jgi:alkylhydroperoxidase family enzyme
MAALVAKWNSCAFCTGAHSAIAAKDIDPSLVQAAMNDFEAADISPKLKAMLKFLQKMTREPVTLTAADARSVLQTGVTKQALEDGIAVGALFNIVTRYADALSFAMPSSEEFDKAAVMLLKRGYG